MNRLLIGPFADFHYNAQIDPAADGLAQIAGVHTGLRRNLSLAVLAVTEVVGCDLLGAIRPRSNHLGQLADGKGLPGNGSQDRF